MGPQALQMSDGGLAALEAPDASHSRRHVDEAVVGIADTVIVFDDDDIDSG